MSMRTVSKVKNKPYADNTMTKSELGNLGPVNNEKVGEKGGKNVEFEEENKIIRGNKNKSEKLTVDPILKLDYVIGYTGKDLCWSPIKEHKSIVYASGGLLVTLNVKTNQQRFFLGHTDLIT